jgi:hypothetical protein
MNAARTFALLVLCLLALHAGEPVHLAGTLTPKVWTPPQGEPLGLRDFFPDDGDGPPSENQSIPSRSKAP